MFWKRAASVLNGSTIFLKRHLSCEVEHSVKYHIYKLLIMLRPRVLYGVFLYCLVLETYRLGHVVGVQTWYNISWYHTSVLSIRGVIH